MKTGMKLATMLLAMIALLLCVSATRAAEKPKAKIIAGEITKIDGANITLQPLGKTDAGAAMPPLVFATTADTEVVINGEKKAVSDLKVGNKIKARLNAEGTQAVEIAMYERNNATTK